MSKVTVSDKVITKAKEWLVRNSKTWTTAVTRGIAWDLEGKYIAGKDYEACHAWIGHALRGNPKRDFLVLSCHSKLRTKDNCSEEAHNAIVLWLASKDCPFSEYILNRDDEESLTEGGVILLVGPSGLNLNQALWICKVLRYGVEGGRALEVWNFLVKRGVDPLFALYSATYVRGEQGASFTFTGREGHSTVFFDIETKDLPKIFERKPTKDPGNTQTVFVGSVPSYNARGKKLSTTKLTDFFTPVKVSDGWGGTTEAKTRTKEEFADFILKWQEEMQPKPKIINIFKPTKDTVYLEDDL